jgi:O-antigen ligase
MRRGLQGVVMAEVGAARRRSAATPYAPAVLSARVGDAWQDPILRRSAWFVILGIGTVVGRMHELIGPLRLIRPIFVVIALTTMATLAARRRIGEQKSLFTDPSIVLLYTYWAWMIATVPTSIDRGHSVKFVLDIAIVFVFAAMVAAQPATVPQLRQITRGFFSMTAVFGVLLLVRGNPEMDLDGLRYSITASLDPNDCAGFLAIGAPMALAEARRKGAGGWRLISAGMFLIICLALLRTGSRGGFIALAAGIVVVFLSDRGIRVLVGISVLSMAALIGREVAPSLLPARIAAMGNLENDYNLNTYGGRVQIWTRAVKYFAADPVLGVGVDNFAAREGIQMLEDGQPGHWSAPHSAYVQSFIELGLIGGLLFCSAIAVSVRRVSGFFRSPSPVTGTTHPEYLAAVLAFSVSAIFLSHAYSWSFVALVALCAHAQRTLERR